LDNRIIQIMPAAEGWRALYAGRDEAEAPITVVEPLVGWALQEEKIYPNDEKAYRSVVGLDGGDSVVETCPEAANFVRRWEDPQRQSQPRWPTFDEWVKDREHRKGDAENA